MPPAYVKPYVKRQKNDATDAEAICEAVSRPNMRFVETKTPEQQSCLMLHRTRHLFVRQQTAVINAIRAHLAEFGIVAPVGRNGVEQLLGVAADAGDKRLPEIARACVAALVETYFQALDRGDVSALPALFSADCRIHRPGLTEPLKGLAGIGNVVAGAADRYRKFKTEIVSILAEGDMVACHLTHHVEFAAPWTTRLGTPDVAGRSIVWHPIVLFRLSDGKIVEQWVCPDELGMLIDVGVLNAAT